jgi:hypothetical protein
LPFALTALAREVDAAVGILLHTTLDVPGLAPQALGLLDPRAVVLHVSLWTGAGALLWVVLASLRDAPLASALCEEADTFLPLYLRPALTALSLIALLVRPQFPYGFTLPVALTQDWGIASDIAALAAIAALRLPKLRLPAPSVGEVFFIAFLAYALLTPERVRTWDGHPGNEPKYLRMAVSLAEAVSLDVADVSALDENVSPLEGLPQQPLLASLGRALATLGSESARMLIELPRAIHANAIRATRLARQTVAGKEGGIFHVLAPGPSLLLAPTLRLDRALNLRNGTPGRVAFSVLAWNLMAAALVAALFQLLRAATGRAGLAAALAGFLALTPPFLFYAFQFYPEMPGALLLTLCLYLLLFRDWWSARQAMLFGLACAALPWLHQKFLPVFGVLLVMALGKLVAELCDLRTLVGFLLPQVVTLFLFTLLNFAITGSVRPDALFLAWGPGGVTSARIGEGSLGLLLDARYGIVPYVPLYLMALGGLGGGPWRRLRWALAPIIVYYLTVAAADNWSGAVCNLGRYAMPALPMLAVLAAVALSRTSGRRGVAAVALALCGWSALLALRLWQDPRAANDSALLLAKSTFADGNVYVPNLFFRSWNYVELPSIFVRCGGSGRPNLSCFLNSPFFQPWSSAQVGQAARIVAWLLAAAGLGLWLRRAARTSGGASPTRVLAGLASFALVAAFALEAWPSPFRTPRFQDSVDLAPSAVAFIEGASVDNGEVRAGQGSVQLLVRSARPVPNLVLVAAGAGRLRVGGRPLAIPESGTLRAEVELDPLVTLVGRRGASETLARQRLEIETSGIVHLRLEMRGGAP